MTPGDEADTERPHGSACCGSSTDTDPPAPQPGVALIATDLDGTLLDQTGSVSSRARLAIATARDHDLELVAVTARTRHTALPILESTAVRWVICSNGALTYDRELDRIVAHHPISAATTHAVISELRSKIGRVGIGWETLRGCGFDPGFVAISPDLDELAAHPEPAADPAEPVTKMFVAHPDSSSPDDALAHLAPLIPFDLQATTSGPPFLELTARRVDKAKALAALAQHLRIGPDQTVAFGDHLNDLPMLSWAGLGVAMGNAHPSVIKTADRVAPPNSDDGVAQWIEDLLGNVDNLDDHSPVPGLAQGAPPERLVRSRERGPSTSATSRFTHERRAGARSGWIALPETA